MFKSAKSTKTEKAIADGSQSQPPAHSGYFLAQAPARSLTSICIRFGLVPSFVWIPATRSIESCCLTEMTVLRGCRAVATSCKGRRVRIEGSAVRGSVVKPGWICSGLSLRTLGSR